MEQNKKCWLVVWNRNKLDVDKFFAAVGNEVDVSVWLQDEDVRKGDKGVIVVREGDGKPRGVYATFTVTDDPRMMKDTHPDFWKDEDKYAEKMRVRVRFDPRFEPITDKGIVSNPELKMPPNSFGKRWVRSIHPDVYQMVRAHAKVR